MDHQGNNFSHFYVDKILKVESCATVGNSWHQLHFEITLNNHHKLHYCNKVCDLIFNQKRKPKIIENHTKVSTAFIFKL